MQRLLMFIDESITLALESKEKPYIISDIGDNPTAESAGDVTQTLRKILNLAEFQTENGPDLVAKFIELGVGSKVSSLVGAMVDD